MLATAVPEDWYIVERLGGQNRCLDPTEEEDEEAGGETAVTWLLASSLRTLCAYCLSASLINLLALLGGQYVVFFSLSDVAEVVVVVVIVAVAVVDKGEDAG